jgi:ribonuclease Z
MRITILGNNAAVPAFGRHPSAQVVTVYNEDILIDCGEGTQTQMQRYGIKWRRLNHILISHMHGDHYFGLPGLLNSMSLMGRVEPLYLIGPAPLMPILHSILQVADTVLSYPLHFIPLPEGDALVVDTPVFSIHCFPVQHRITCHGYLIQSKHKYRKILPEICALHQVPVTYFDALKQGADYVNEQGTVVPNALLTLAPTPPKKYAYCADTLYTTSFLPFIQGVDAMYHESTYLQVDAVKAEARFHTTAQQAAQLAAKAQAKLLLLGHFSSKYKDLAPFAAEAQAFFENTLVTTEGSTYEL